MKYKNELSKKKKGMAVLTAFAHFHPRMLTGGIIWFVSEV